MIFDSCTSLAKAVRRALYAASIATITLSPSIIHAEEASEDTADNKEDKNIVTGSRIKRTEAEGLLRLFELQVMICPNAVTQR